MEKIFVGVRDVDKEVFKKFRAMSVEKRMKLGEALTKAMIYWLAKEREKIRNKRLKGVYSLLEVKPFNWGPGTEKTSSEIDEILYGLKK